MAKILVVDDEEIARVTLKHALNKAEMDVTLVSSAKEALELLKNEQFDLIMTDLMMPEMDGIRFLNEVKFIDEKIPVIAVTSLSTVDKAKEVLQSGGFNFITKPFKIDEVLKTVKKGLTCRNEIVRNREAGSLAECVLNLEIPSRSELLGGAIFCMLEQLRMIGFSERIISTEILMALDEAITNAHVHGNNEDQGKKIFLHIKIDNKKMELSIRDEGDGFAPDKLIDPLSPEGIERNCGRGIFLIKGYMDEVSFNDKGNEITLVKHNEG